MYVAMRLRINDAAGWYSALRTTVATIIRKTHTTKFDSWGGETFRESSTKRTEDTHSNFWAGEVQLFRGKRHRARIRGYPLNWKEGGTPPTTRLQTDPASTAR